MRTLVTTLTVALACTVSVGLSACDDGGDSLPSKLCSQYRDCYPEDFADDYATFGECTSDIQAELAYARQEYTSACYSAGTRYMNCTADLNCSEDPEIACASEGLAVEEACAIAITNPCPGYVAGTDSDECCQAHDPCDWAGDEFCDCSDTCSWDIADCAMPR